MKESNHNHLVSLLIQNGYLKTSTLQEAFRVVDRADFISDEEKMRAYEDTPLLIEKQIVGEQPSIVAFMLELLVPRPGEKILEIGTRSGWTTALIAQSIKGSEQNNGLVMSIEKNKTFYSLAEKKCTIYGYEKGNEQSIIMLIEGDEMKGYRKEAPYDAIIVNGAVKKIPEVWKQQLKIGGRIVVPIGESIYLIEKKGQDEYKEHVYYGFHCTPLKEG